MLSRILTPENFKSFVSNSQRMEQVVSRRSSYDNEEDKSSEKLVLRMNVIDLFRNSPRANDLRNHNSVHSNTVMRNTLCSLLLKNVFDLDVETGVNLLEKQIVSVTPDGNSLRDSEDKLFGPYDLIVGGDGVNSCVADYVSNTSNQQKIYSGIKIKYAVAKNEGGNLRPNVSSSRGVLAANELHQFFGRGGYALTGTYGEYDMGAIIFADDEFVGPFRVKNLFGNKGGGAEENTQWAESLSTAAKSQSQQFIELAKLAQIPLREGVQQIAESADSFFELAVYFRNPFQKWSRERVVLIGDAAHASPPFLGQGANQALQDSFLLAKVIEKFNKNEDGGRDFTALFDQAVAERKFFTTGLTLKALFLGYLEVGYNPLLSRFRDGFFFLAGKIGLAKKVFLDGATPVPALDTVVQGVVEEEGSENKN